MDDQDANQSTQDEAPRTRQRRLETKTSTCFPRFLTCWLVWINWFGLVVLLVYLVGQFCVYLPVCFEWSSPNIQYTYAALGFLLFVLLSDRLLRHSQLEWRWRLEDPSIVRSKLLQAKNYVSSASKDADEDKRASAEELNTEVGRLTALGEESWTEYELLNLQQMMIDFWEREDLIESAKSYLIELEEYAQDSKYRYEWAQLDRRKRDVEKLLEKLSRDEYEESHNEVVDERRLKAQVEALIEHITDYNYFWSVGTSLIRGLTVFGGLATGILILMGVLPLIHPNGSNEIEIFNWAFLGTGGALTASLQILRQSDAIEIGDTEGKREIRNALLGAVLGFVAGIIAFALISGGLLYGELFPSIPPTEGPNAADAGRSIFWAIAAGYSFERMFDRLRSASNSLTA